MKVYIGTCYQGTTNQNEKSILRMKNHLTPPSDKDIYQEKKRVETTSIDKDVVKMKATFTVGGNEIFLSFYGKQDSPEKKNKVW